MNLRVGIVGSGFIARQHVRSWGSLGVQPTLYSQDAGEAALLAERYPVTLVDTLEELLSVVDLVDVCTPTDQHPAVVHAASTAGLDVICEKPLALTGDEAAAMIRRCAASGVRLFPAHVVRYVSEYAAARVEIDRGSIGTPAILHLSRSGPRPTWADWFADESRSGGVLMDLMIHDYDIAAWFCGPVRRVYARVRRGESGKEVGTAVLTHRSGAVSHIRGVWGAERSPLLTAFRIYGDGGYLATGTGSRQEVLRRDEDGGERRLPVFTDGIVDPYALELADFAAAAETHGIARVFAEDGLAAVRVAEAALRSAETGETVHIEEAGE